MRINIKSYALTNCSFLEGLTAPQPVTKRNTACASSFASCSPALFSMDNVVNCSLSECMVLARAGLGLLLVLGSATPNNDEQALAVDSVSKGL